MVLLGMGTLNCYRWTQPALLGDPIARHRLRRLTSLEVGIAILILATATLWRFTPPPRSLSAVEVSKSEAQLFLFIYMTRPPWPGWTFCLLPMPKANC